MIDIILILSCFGLFICFFINSFYLKKYNSKKIKSDIVLIKDIEMSVKSNVCIKYSKKNNTFNIKKGKSKVSNNKDNQKSKKSKGSKKTFKCSKKYFVYFKGTEDENKVYKLEGKDNYFKFKDTNKVYMQEIFYNYKGEIFSELYFKEEVDCSILEKYKSSNNDKLISEEEIIRKSKNLTVRINNFNKTVTNITYILVIISILSALLVVKDNVIV